MVSLANQIMRDDWTWRQAEVFLDQSEVIIQSGLLSIPWHMVKGFM